jgi:NADH-quinone oxidoreductase subunit J
VANFHFWLFAVLAIAGALLCVTRRSPVASALWLVLTMFSLAGIYVLLDAQFIAAVQIMVYAGAIMVLFLFVIMLLNLGNDGSSDMLGWPGRIFGALLAGVLIVEFWAVRNLLPSDALQLPAGSMEALAVREGAVGAVAQPLFERYIVPFEITGVLLLAATAGAIVLAKRKL